MRDECYCGDLIRNFQSPVAKNKIIHKNKSQLRHFQTISIHCCQYYSPKMLSFNKSINFALRSPKIRQNCLSIFSNNYCAQFDRNNEIRLAYLTDERQGIAIIELNRENGKNSFSRNMASKIHECIDILSTDKNVRAVIVRSLVKGVFCAGADLKERKTMTPVEVHRFVNSLRSLVVKMENLPMPTIAAIDGNAGHSFFFCYLVIFHFRCCYGRWFGTCTVL